MIGVGPLEELVRRRLLEGGRGALVPAAPRFARFLAMVLEANEVTNLVSRASAGPEELVERHLLDSLAGLELLPPAGDKRLRLLDIGSGAGFPAVPLLIARGDLEGTLVESVGKKCRVLEGVAAGLHLTARVLNARFPAPHMQHPFDILTSRAVADAGGLVRAARPHLAPGARVLLWTTEPLLDEIRKRSGIQRLDFHRSPGAQVRGVAMLECST